MLYGDGIRFRFAEDSDGEYIVNLRNDSMKDQNWFFSPDPLCLWKHNAFMINARHEGDKFFIIEIPDRSVWVAAGIICAYNINFLHRNCEIGRFIIDKNFRRNGYGESALKLIYKYCFNNLGMNKVYFEVLCDNFAALELYEKSGCKQDGIKRQHIFKNGDYMDVLILSILRDEYNKRHPE